MNTEKKVPNETGQMTLAQITIPVKLADAMNFLSPIPGIIPDWVSKLKGELGIEGGFGVRWRKNGNCKEFWAWKITRMSGGFLGFMGECVEIEIWYTKICDDQENGAIQHYTHKFCDLFGDVSTKDIKAEVEKAFGDNGLPLPPTP